MSDSSRASALPPELFARVTRLRQHLTAGMQGGLHVISELDLSLAQGMALILLSEQGPLTVSALQSGVGRSQAATSQLVEQLEQRDMVRRQTDADDRRRRVVTLAAAGRAAVRKLETVRRAAVEDVLGPLPGPLLRRFDSVLADILDVLDP